MQVVRRLVGFDNVLLEDRSSPDRRTGSRLRRRLGATDVSVGGSHDHDVVRSRGFDLRIQPGCDRLSRSAVSSVVPRVVEGRPLPARNAARRGRGGSQVQGGACAIA